LAAATVRDIVCRFVRICNNKGIETIDWNTFSNTNAIHVNDSQTAMAPIELFRILIDEQMLSWDEAFRIVFDSTTFTHHSLHFARDKWPCDLLARILPRHLELIYKINYYMMQDFKNKVDLHTL
jgi:starch phosphorylase